MVLKQEDQILETNLGYTVRSCLKRIDMCGQGRLLRKPASHRGIGMIKLNNSVKSQ